MKGPFDVTQRTEPVSTGSAPSVPATRRERRDAERAAEFASIHVAQRPSPFQVVEGAAPIYRSRREMREAATRLARDIDVTVATDDAPVASPITIPAPAFGVEVTLDSAAEATLSAGAVEPAPAPVAETPDVADASEAPEVTADAPDPAAPTGIRIEDITPSTPTMPPVRAPRTARGLSASAPRQARRRPLRGSRLRRSLQRMSAMGALVFIGSLIVVTSLPAQAFTPSEPIGLAIGDVEAQSLQVSGEPHGDEDVSFLLSRDDFTVDDAITSQTFNDEELADLQAVADSERIGDYYGGKPALPKVWELLETDYTQSPFPSLSSIPVSSGFGYRWGGFHGGVDMIPGAGTPVYPVANGVVSAVWQGNNPGGGGYQVIVDHNIDGQFFQSWYPHLQAGSIEVEEGQVVDITTMLGAVGSTGNSTGAHLHLEIKNSDYISFDPLVWLATREEYLEP